MVKHHLRNPRLWAADVSLVLQLGLTMAGCIAFGFFTGRWLDGWLGGGGIWTVLLLLFGIIGGGVVCYRQIMAALPPGGPQDSGTGHGPR